MCFCGYQCVKGVHMGKREHTEHCNCSHLLHKETAMARVRARHGLGTRCSSGSDAPLSGTATICFCGYWAVVCTGKKDRNRDNGDCVGGVYSSSPGGVLILILTFCLCT